MTPPNNSIPFLFQKDTDLVIWHSEAKRTMLSLAELLCTLAGDRGLVGVNIPDHDLEQRVKDSAAVD